MKNGTPLIFLENYAGANIRLAKLLLRQQMDVWPVCCTFGILSKEDIEPRCLSRFPV